LFSKTREAQLPPLPQRAPVNIGAFEDSIDGRADALDHALRATCVSRDYVGTPFGPGFWLDEVAGWVGQLIPAPLEYHPVGGRAADSIIAAVQARNCSFDAIDRALGIDEGNAGRFGLSKAQAFRNLDAIQEMKELLISMAKMDMGKMERWFQDEAFAHRMVAYFQVARHRLIASGVTLVY
jgi:hypothetical protein